MSQTKNIIFDVGNVLVDFRPREYMLDLGFSPETADFLFQKLIYSPLWDELDRSLRPQEEIVRDMKAYLPDYEGEIDLFFEKIEDIVTIRTYSKQWLGELRARGYHVYLLSNYPETLFQIHAKTRFDFLSEVDGMVISGQVKQVKPEREIYETLLSTYHLKPEECVFIDDRQGNVQMAGELHFQTILFTTYEETRQALEEKLI